MPCPACGDVSRCRGGGDKACIKRDPKPSVIVGIIDTYGGLRTVVCHRRDVHHHVRHDELGIIVPRLRVHEPIGWGDIPMVIGRAELEIEKWLERHGMPNDPVKHECVTMYRLRCKESPLGKKSFDPSRIAYT